MQYNDYGKAKEPYLYNNSENDKKKKPAQQVVGTQKSSGNASKKFKPNESEDSFSSYTNGIPLNNNGFNEYNPFEDKLSMTMDINAKFNVIDKKDSCEMLNETKSSANKSVESASTKSNQFNKGAGGFDSSQNCADCGKVFTNKSALAKHRLIHRLVSLYSNW